MDQRRMVTVSKFLSKHLRHAPEDLGLTLDVGGWVAVDDLLAGCANHGFRISREELVEVVEKNDKQRFSFDESGARIRANQGHSTAVDLQLEPQTPPDVLFHGTATNILSTVLKDGLKRMSRHHVHLSTTVATAIKVGSRHGKPVVLAVDAAAMHKAGILFYCSDNGVWLVDEVPPEYLRVQ
jgi:putative RNA 2'-phosphotransferase